MRTAYQKACSYSYVLSNGHNDYKGAVHQAYIYYFNKTGENLFEQPEGFILRCVKWMTRWRWSNDHRKKHFSEFEDHIFNSSTPLQELESKEEVEKIYQKIRNYHSGGITSINPDTLLQFLWHLERGYQVQEIIGLMGLTKGQAYNYKAKLKSILRPMTNPFAANPAPISKKILRKTFEENEKYRDYVYDTNRNCDANEYYQLVVHKDRDEYLLIREPEGKFEIQ